MAEMSSRPRGRTDWDRVDRLTGDDIASAAASDPDGGIPAMDWSAAKIYAPMIKLPMSLRVDPDVLEYFKSLGKGYQTRMNAVLRSYMEHQSSARKQK